VNEPAPSRLLNVLRHVGSALDARGESWALVGGLAVSVRAEPRFTRDVDLAVAVENDAAAETLVSELVAGGFRLLLSLEHRALNRLSAVRLSPPGEHEEGIVVDLLFSSSGIEADICAAAERIEVAPGLTVPVGQAGHLVAMKLLSTEPDRPQDEVDLRSLLAVLTRDERARARQAVLGIEAAGANRSRPLTEELERRLSGATGPTNQRL
jgi:hypothetical protein